MWFEGQRRKDGKEQRRQERKKERKKARQISKERKDTRPRIFLGGREREREGERERGGRESSRRRPHDVNIRFLS
jgi:hypothetical protein